MIALGRAARGSAPRRWLIAAAIIPSLALAVVLLLLFGWPLLRALVAVRLSTALGRTVTISSLDRQGGTLLRPTLVIGGVHVAQPSWAGSGDIASVDRLAIQLPLLPLLAGQFRPETIRVSHVHLQLSRSSNGRLNWTDRARPIGPPVLGNLRIADGLLEFLDAKSDRSLTARFTLDEAGFRLLGRGRLGQQPLTLTVHGEPIDPVRPAAPWPFGAELISPRVAINLEGVADYPLNIDHFTAHLAAHGHDLHDLNQVIEAGLPGTQPFDLHAELRHDAPDWTLKPIAGTLGRSDFAGRIEVRPRNGRAHVDATLVAQQLDFRDLASDKGQSVAAAHFRQYGPRLIPDTAIHLEHLRNAEATVRFVIHRLLFAKRSPFVSLTGKAILDHGVLTVKPLVAGLVHGRIAGTARVDHRSGQPHLSLDLRLIDSRIENVLVKPGEATGPLRGTIRLTGDGRTVRAALSRADGTVALVVEQGNLPASTAELIGQDAGGLVAGKSRVELRCAIAHFSVRQGIAKPTPLLIDTALSSAKATGAIDLSNERIALSVAGRRKYGSVVRLVAPLHVDGILERPVFGLSPRAKSSKGIFKAIGRALFGGGGDPPAPDVDCENLARRALK